jgi:hypothetical protein
MLSSHNFFVRNKHADIKQEMISSLRHEKVSIPYRE